MKNNMLTQLKVISTYLIWSPRDIKHCLCTFLCMWCITCEVYMAKM